MYHYRCQVVNVVDGDTLDCVLDLGIGIMSRQRVRLWGINTKERNTPEGLSATSFLRFMVIGKPLTVHTLKDKTEKYGRLLGLFYEQNTEWSVNQKLLDQGYAVPYMVTLNGTRLPEVKDGTILL